MLVQISALAFIISFGTLLWALPKKGFADSYFVPKVGKFKLNILINLKFVRMVIFVAMYAIVIMLIAFVAFYVPA